MQNVSFKSYSIDDPHDKINIYRMKPTVYNRTNVHQKEIITVYDCLPGEEEIKHADGTVSCKKFLNGRVVAKKGPRKDRIVEDCLPGETRVVKPNGNVICRKQQTSTKVVTDYDDDTYTIVPKKTSRNGGVIVVDDDDDIVIVPVPIPVPVPVVPVPAPVPVIPIPAPIPYTHTGGCDVDGIGGHQAVTGNGNLLYGSDCSHAKTGCMVSLPIFRLIIILRFSKRFS